MSEDEFWHCNPRKLRVWELGYRNEANNQNFLNYISGSYVLRAMQVAIDHAFNKNAKSEYYEKPIRIFEMTEEEKQELELQKFIAWAGGIETKYNK